MSKLSINRGNSIANQGVAQLDTENGSVVEFSNQSQLHRRPATRIIIQPIHRVAVLSVAIVYSVALLVVLKISISRVYAYEGYGFEPIDDVTHSLWTWLLLLLIGVALPIRVAKPSSFFVWLIFLVVYVPAQLIPTYALGYGLEYAAFQGVVFACMLALVGVGMLPPIRFPEPRWSFKVFVVGLVIYSSVMMLWLVTQVGVPTSIPTFSNVYVQRAAFGAAIAGAGPVLYLIAWQTSVVNPMLILAGVFTKRWGLAATGVALNILMYSLAGHKSHLFSSVLVFAVVVLLQIRESARGILVACGTIGLVISSQVLFSLTGAIYPISIFVRRMLMLPGMLTGYYFDFFSELGYTYRFGPLAMFFTGVELEQSPPSTIALEYFGSTTGGANANFWADSFSALGYLGMVLATILLALVLWLMDSLSISRPAMIATPLFVVALYSLTNSALPTSLLTHGILVAVLAIWMMPLSSSHGRKQHEDDSRLLESDIESRARPAMNVSNE